MKLKYLIILSMLLSLFGCQKDDSNSFRSIAFNKKTQAYENLGYSDSLAQKLNEVIKNTDFELQPIQGIGNSITRAFFVDDIETINTLAIPEEKTILLVWDTFYTVIVDGIQYQIDPYEKLFDVVREIIYSKNSNYYWQDYYTWVQLWEYDYTYDGGIRPCGCNTSDNESVSFDTFVVYGKVSLSDVARKFGITIDTKYHNIEELFLASKIFPKINDELIYKGLKIKLVAQYKNKTRCFLVKLVDE